MSECVEKPVPVFITWLIAEMAPKTKGDAKPKADKKEKKPAPKKVDASKKETKDAKAPVKAVQKALKVSIVRLLTVRMLQTCCYRSRRRWWRVLMEPEWRRSELASSSTGPRLSGFPGETNFVRIVLSSFIISTILFQGP